MLPGGSAGEGGRLGVLFRRMEWETRAQGSEGCSLWCNSVLAGVQDLRGRRCFGKNCTKRSHGGMKDAKAAPALLGLLGGLSRLEGNLG